MGKWWPVWLEQSERGGEGRRRGQGGEEDKLCGAVVRHIALRARPSWVQVLDLLLNSWVTLGSATPERSKVSSSFGFLICQMELMILYLLHRIEEGLGTWKRRGFIYEFFQKLSWAARGQRWRPGSQRGLGLSEDKR